MWALPAATHSFGIIKWSDTELDGLDRLTKRLQTKFLCLIRNHL
jgi:hypothetical protein